jgi:hypothetical protein
MSEGDWKLSEFRRGLFFTADAEAVEFSPDRVAIGNRPFARTA